MYYKLNLGGRAVWTVSVFMVWLAMTLVLASTAINFGMDSGDAFRQWCRSAGYNPALSDIYKLLWAVFGFLMVPILTTVIIAKLNKKLKGQKHERA